MLIEIKRRGGLAGVALRTRVSTEELDDETAGRVEAAVSRLMDKGQMTTEAHPDMFWYEIGVPERGASVTVGEHDVPEELRPLIERLSATGAIEPR